MFHENIEYFVAIYSQTLTNYELYEKLKNGRMVSQWHAHCIFKNVQPTYLKIFSSSVKKIKFQDKVQMCNKLFAFSYTNLPNSSLCTT